MGPSAKKTLEPFFSDSVKLSQKSRWSLKKVGSSGSEPLVWCHPTRGREVESCQPILIPTCLWCLSALAYKCFSKLGTTKANHENQCCCCIYRARSLNVCLSFSIYIVALIRKVKEKPPRNKNNASRTCMIRISLRDAAFSKIHCIKYKCVIRKNYLLS